MTKKQNSSQSDNARDKREPTQTIINEMKAQGFLDEFTDGKTGEARFEIRFSDRSMICKVENAGKDN
jgi:hypothetical protein